jgi:hypothetical protein
MLIKTKKPEPEKPKSMHAKAGNVRTPVRCTGRGELEVYQANSPGFVGTGINRYNKDGVLVLGDDGKCLRNVRVDPDGAVVVRHDQPIDVTLEEVRVNGHVTVDNTLTVDPVTVANMPDQIRIQEGLHIATTL